MKLIILGINGSIGKQTIDVLKKFNYNFELVAFSFGDNTKNAKVLINEFHPLAVSFKNEIDYKTYSILYPDIKMYYGFDAYLLLLNTEYDALINALSGFSGLEPSLIALKDNKTLLLANKESLVCAGFLIKDILKTSGKLIPIDSEHVAILKCLEGENRTNIKKITITASGGPFFEMDDESLKNVSVNEALNHPTWKMGKRITIDSSTMVNKCFELIEGAYLFGCDLDMINVLVDRNSLIHGLVEFNDGRIKECSYSPSMGNPIKYALDKLFNKEIDLSDIKVKKEYDLSLKLMKKRYYPILNLSKLVYGNNTNAGVILNSIDEELVRLFLDNKIKYVDINAIIVKIMNAYKFKECNSYKELQEYNKEAKNLVKEYLG